VQPLDPAACFIHRNSVTLRQFNLYCNRVAMTPEQSKAARVMVGWGVRDLAKAAKVSSNTVSRLERGAQELQEETIAKLRTALEKAGIIFIAENGGGAGVRLKKRKAKR
jgi:transcriptional regulator with XRE-family HTH domain